MSVSTLQQRANQRNAQRSTGPRTEEGKQRSAQNALSLGVYAKSPVLPGEDPRRWVEFRDDMLARLNPRDPLELQLADQVIWASWNLERLRSTETRFIELRIKQDLQTRQDARQKQLDGLRQGLRVQQAQLGYQNTSRTRAKIEETRASLERLEKQFEANPLTPLNGDEILALLLASADPALERLYRHQQRLENSMHRALNKLQALQRKLICDTNPFTRSQLSKNEPKTAVVEPESGSADESDGVDGRSIRGTGVPPGLATLENEPSGHPVAPRTD